VYYLYSGAAVTLNLGANTASGGHAAGDALSGFEGAVGSALGDTLTGSAAVNTLDGQGGGDTLIGRDGNDTLTGGEGTDTFYGGPGTDTCDDVVGETVTSCEV
jgi:Ca2+-binding RTX toxin-like protein